MAEKYARNLIIAKRYRLIEVLGRGNFSEVWKAADLEENENLTVLKIFLPGKGFREKNLSAFFEILKAFPCPESDYLVPFRYIEWDHCPVKIMPFYEAGSLKNRLGNVNVAEAVQFFHDGACALSELQANKASGVHYDLQPDRFLINSKGHFLLKDYELTPEIHKILAAQAGQPNIPLGASAYKAPEQFSGAPGQSQFTPKGNIFGLGSLFYQLLTGELPFGELGGVAMRATTPVPELPYKWSLFQPVLEKMLARNPSLRPTAEELSDMKFPLPGISGKKEKIKISPKVWLGSASVLIIILLVIILIHFISNRQEQKPRNEPVKLSKPTEALPSDPLSAPDTTTAISVSPDTTFVAEDLTPVNAVRMEWIQVEGGDFLMGNPDTLDRKHPLRKISVKAFSIGKYEVTVAQYRAFCLATDRKMPYEPPWGWQDNQPIVRVTWHDAKAFAEWMGGRLPTEAEWEFAAKGGTKSRGFVYSGSNQADEVAWHPGNANARPHEAGTKKPNELGIFDMSGNVWEWCNDWYAEEPSASGPAFGKTRSLRGGSFYFDNLFGRIFHRHHSSPDLVSQNIGFRIVR